MLLEAIRPHAEDFRESLALLHSLSSSLDSRSASVARFKCVFCETFHIIKLQELIELPLVTDRTAQAIANISTARGARAMIGINHDVVRQLQVEVAQGMELLLSQLLRVFSSKQVGAPGGRNE